MYPLESTYWRPKYQVSLSPSVRQISSKSSFPVLFICNVSQIFHVRNPWNHAVNYHFQSWKNLPFVNKPNPDKTGSRQCMSWQGGKRLVKGHYNFLEPKQRKFVSGNKFRPGNKSKWPLHFCLVWKRRHTRKSWNPPPWPFEEMNLLWTNPKAMATSDWADMQAWLVNNNGMFGFLDLSNLLSRWCFVLAGIVTHIFWENTSLCQTGMRDQRT